MTELKNLKFKSTLVPFFYLPPFYYFSKLVRSFFFSLQTQKQTDTL